MQAINLPFNGPYVELAEYVQEQPTSSFKASSIVRSTLISFLDRIGSRTLSHYAVLKRRAPVLLVS